MPSPTSADEFLELARKSGVVDEQRLQTHAQKLRDQGQFPAEPAKLAALLVQDGLLTQFQADQLLQGKWRRFTIGKYRVLERLGSGGMGSVFLCEHKFMRRRVAVKVLPSAKAADPASLERFYREARAVAAVDHPNIVHAYDIDQAEDLHFLVMEYVDGPSLQEIVRRGGPVSLERACHYISQAARGLEHAREVGLVHRDIKPGNILVDSAGVVKILDMGLAKFFHDQEDLLTRKYDENVLGTADYLAPEQADDSHTVDIRADIYALGGTFYFLLTGRTPFGEGTVPQKLMWHRTRQPKPINTYRTDVPAEVQALIDKMLAKEPGQRYQSPGEVCEALAPWTNQAIPPPLETEMPRLSPALGGSSPPQAGESGSDFSSAKKSWKVSGEAASPESPSNGAGKVELVATIKLSAAAAAKLKRQAFSAARLSELTEAASDVPHAPSTKSTPAKEGAASWTDDEPETGPLARDATPEQLPALSVTAPNQEPATVGTSQESPASPGKPARPEVGAKSTDATGATQAPAQRVQEQASGRAAKPRLVVGAWTATACLVFALIVSVVLWLFGAFSAPQRMLKVGKGEPFPSVAAALAEARSGDRIVLVDKEHRESLILDGPALTKIEIRSADGLEVTWTALPLAYPHEPLIRLGNAQGFQVKGIRFDGEGRTQNLVWLTGHCPGLRLENLKLEGFTKSAVVIANCSGTSAEPVTIASLKTSSGGRLTDCAILFDTARDASPNNEFIQLDNCQLLGTFGHGELWFKAERSKTIVVR